MLRPMLAAFLLAVLATGARAAAPDYTEYQSLLDRYLVRLDPKAKETDTRFDYERLYVDERIVQLHRSALLERVHATLVAIHPAELSPAERTAWAINTYNYLVLERATLRLLQPGKRLVRQRGVDDMRTAQGQFFSSPAIDVDGRPYTLAEFERRFVLEDTTDVLEPRTLARDPRRSLALCGGHMGDPPLATRAYRGDSLDVQLDAATRTTLAQERFVRFHEDTRLLDVADYLAQRRVDLGGSVDAIIPFVERYGPSDVRRAIRKFQVRRVTHVIPTDTVLNQWPRSRSTPAATPSTSG